MDKKNEVENELIEYNEYFEKLKEIEEALNLDPKVRIKDVEKTIMNLEN